MHDSFWKGTQDPDFSLGCHESSVQVQDSDHSLVYICLAGFTTRWLDCQALKVDLAQSMIIPQQEICHGAFAIFLLPKHHDIEFLQRWRMGLLVETVGIGERLQYCVHFLLSMPSFPVYVALAQTLLLVVLDLL